MTAPTPLKVEAMTDPYESGGKVNVIYFVGGLTFDSADDWNEAQAELSVAAWTAWLEHIRSHEQPV